MIRSDEALAVHEIRYGHSTAWMDLGGGHILLHALGDQVCTADDGGITWFDPFAGKNEDGSKLLASCACVIRLDGNLIALAHIEQNSKQRGDTIVVFKRSTDGGRTCSGR